MEEETVVNLKTEIEKYAVPRNSVGDVTNSDNPAKASKIKSFVENKIAALKSEIQTWVDSNYYNKTTTSSTYLSKEDATSTYLSIEDANSSYLEKDTADTSYAPISHEHNFDVNMYAHPIATTETIDHLLDPGYYQYVGSYAIFTFIPDNVHYTNGYIKVEQQSNQIIQHVYATSYSTTAHKYKIDGREYVRHGYTSGTGDSLVKNWGEWYVKHIPWQERSDLLKNKGTNVADNSFTIYECTAGYVFKWLQPGDDHKFVLPVSQNNYTSIYTFKDLPIIEPYLIGNLVGHMDVKITHDEFKIRSTNRNGEYLVGVDGSYFVPRTN